MNGSDNIATNSMSIWRFAIFLAAALAVGLYISNKVMVLENIFWIGDDIEIHQDDGRWLPGKVFDIGHSHKIQEIRFQVKVNSANHWQSPVGLIVGGPFSAELIWDGQIIGNKGMVGDTPLAEVPGNIDSITLIPAAMLESGTHQLRMRISTQNMNYEATRIIHIAALAPYRYDERRSLRYYALPLLLLSGLLLLMVQSLRIGINAGDRLYTGLGIFAGFVALSLLTEVSRAMINYPYTFHIWRVTVMWLSSIFAGLSLSYLCYRVDQQKWIRYALVGGLIVFSLSYFFAIGGDRQITRNFILLSATPSMIYGYLWYRRQISFLSMMPIYWLACLISANLSYGIFLDAYFYVASIIFLTSAWFWVYVGQDEVSMESDPAINPLHLMLKSKGKEIYVEIQDILYIKAEGNYAKIVKADGSILLHHLRLGEIMETPPQGFIRVHRSYAVNKKHIKALRVAEGSKYWLEIHGTNDIPVSRHRVYEIRTALN